MHIFCISIQERFSTKNKVIPSLKRDFSPQHPGFTRKNGNFEGKFTLDHAISTTFSPLSPILTKSPPYSPLLFHGLQSTKSEVRKQKPKRSRKKSHLLENTFKNYLYTFLVASSKQKESRTLFLKMQRHPLRLRIILARGTPINRKNTHHSPTLQQLTPKREMKTLRKLNHSRK